jgi:hypothetical protein
VISAVRRAIAEVKHRGSVIGWVTCVVDYGPFSLCVIHKKGLCPSSRVTNRLMMIMKTRAQSIIDDYGLLHIVNINRLMMISYH